MTDELSGHDVLIGESQVVKNVREEIRQLANADCHVLITGETGTGKEIVARLIHRNSRRSHRPMVALNCAAFKDSLLESESFRHERGAFTGAYQSRIGMLEHADGGIVFLDEIGDMALDAQAKLLRAIESKEFYRLGSTRLIRINVRILAATHRDPLQLIDKGLFRADLYHRITVVQIRLPPLRERPGDVLLLADHFLREYSRLLEEPPPVISAEVRDAFGNYPWTGNVRELKNVIEAALVRHPWPCIELTHLPLSFKVELGQERNHERQRILQALEEAGQNRSLAAERLGWSHAKFYRKIDEHQIDKRPRRSSASRSGPASGGETR